MSDRGSLDLVLYLEVKSVMEEYDRGPHFSSCIILILCYFFPFWLGEKKEEILLASNSSHEVIPLLQMQQDLFETPRPTSFFVVRALRRSNDRASVSSNHLVSNLSNDHLGECSAYIGP